MMFRPYLAIVWLASLLVVAPTVQAQAASEETIGDWRVSEVGDPFDDGVQQGIMYIVSGQRRSIQAVAIACVSSQESSHLSLRVIHPYLIPDRDDENLLQIRFGEDESRVEWGSAATDNTRTDLEIRWDDIVAFRAAPNLAVRITEGASHTNDQYTESWSSIPGTAEAIDRMLAECAPTPNS